MVIRATWYLLEMLAARQLALVFATIIEILD